MPAVFIKTLGCKVNNYDAMAIMGAFASLGYSVAESAGAADVIILNTCSVTQNADREARYLVRKMHREAPGALLVATGCYAQTNPRELGEIAELHHVVPQSRKESLAELVDQLYRNRMTDKAASESQIHGCTKEPSRPPLILAPLDSTQTRCYIRIQDGCESFCSYCIIPYARGAIRSVPLPQVAAEVARLDGAGVREIVLTGIHLGLYGKDLHPDDPLGDHLGALVHHLVAGNALSHARLRLSSLEPMELSSALIHFAAKHPRHICPHFHLPLQSGSDRILKLMHRPYDAASYLAKVREITAAIPGVNISSDVIVGFPGESDEDFAATCRIVAAAAISKVHVFPFSPRQGTPAAQLPDAIDPAVIAARAASLREQSERQEAAYRKSAVGSRLELLWEESFDAKGHRIGRAQNYLEAILETPDNEPRGTLTAVVIAGLDEHGMLVARKAP